jgi:hypothetical protein
MKVRIKTLFALISFAFAYLYICGANADAVDVYYGGMALYGKYSDLEKNFKFSKKLFDSGELEIAYRNLFQSGISENSHVRLKFEKAITINQSVDIVTMAVAVCREDFATETMRDGVKVVLNLGVKVVFLNLTSKSFMNSYPINIEIIDLLSSPPDDSYKAKLVRDVLLGNGEGSVQNGLREAVKSFSPGSSKIRTVSVTSSSVAPPAKTVLFEGTTESAEVYADLLARYFSDELVRNLRINVVPGGRDSLNGKMSMVFADGKEHDFTIPAPTYAVDLTLTDLQQKELARTSVEIAYAYGAFLSVKVHEPESGAVFFDKVIIHGASKKVAASSGEFDERQVYREVVHLALKKAVNEMGKDKKFKKEVLARCVSE